MFFSRDLLFIAPIAPAISESVSGLIAYGIANGLLAASQSNPNSLARAGNPGTNPYRYSPDVWARWGEFFGQTPPSPDFEMRTDPGPSGIEYSFSQVSKWKRLPPLPSGTVTDITNDIRAIGQLGEIGYKKIGAGQAIRVMSQTETGAPVPVSISSTYNELFEFQSLESISFHKIASPTENLPVTYPYELPASETGQPSEITGTAQLPASAGVLPGTSVLPFRLPNPGDIGNRPLPILFPETIPSLDRERLPQVWIFPDGIQVGVGHPSDRVHITVGESAHTLPGSTPEPDFLGRNGLTLSICEGEQPQPSDCCDCDHIRQIVIDELDSKFPPKRPVTYQEVTFAPANSGEFVLPAFTEWVLLEIVTIGSVSRTQSGGGFGPDVRYNGWYSFGMVGTTGERMPFHYDSLSISVPSGASGFSFTVYAEATAKVTIRYAIPST